MESWLQDRAVVLMMGEYWTRRHLDRRIVAPMMTWWLQTHEIGLKDNFLEQCWYCGHMPESTQPRLCLDHAFPDYYDSTPLVPCCLTCNRIKGAYTPNEIRQRRSLGLYWFESVTLATSPLAYAIQEDFRGFRSLLAHYLNMRKVREA
jgi:hypothetical protein